MKDLSDDPLLQEVGVNSAILDPNEKDVITRLELLEKCLRVTSKGNYEQRLLILEERMIQIMDKWVFLQGY